ncbi:MAG TPA: hypothetical protein VK171_03305, partial [Fimbriimonas sp.]|nr:hypothetical protein [Fimbriimonas sp.]
WSTKFVKALTTLGHEATIETKVPEGMADLAIVNLGEANIAETITQLKALGVFTLAHAGHKEKDLIALGKEHQVDRIATNGEITHKFESIIAAIAVQKS